MLKNYRELHVWQKSYKFCLEIYAETRTFPKEEKYGLTAQMRRAAVSIPSNIAEGYGRKTTQQYLQGLYLSYGSLCEIETQLLICRDLDYINTDSYHSLQSSLTEIERMLKALIRSLEHLLIK
jgi:four helix bundle protein